jgi:hypothetical protein
LAAAEHNPHLDVDWRKALYPDSTHERSKPQAIVGGHLLIPYYCTIILLFRTAGDSSVTSLSSNNPHKLENIEKERRNGFESISRLVTQNHFETTATSTQC